MAGYDNLQQVAQVLKSNGTDGELVVSFREIAPEDINVKEPVFIYFDGLPVPFFIESFTKRGNSKALVRLTDICSMEDVEEIAGKAVYVEEDSLPELSLEEDGYAALVGWTVLVPGDFSTPLRSGRNDMVPEGECFPRHPEQPHPRHLERPEGDDRSIGQILSDKILYEAGVFITPGFIFGKNGEDYVRISLCAKPEVLKKAAEKIKGIL